MSDARNAPILVTGCSSGIGRAIAIRLARSGLPVFASARRLESIEDLATEGCKLLALDVTDSSSRRSAVERIEAEYGAVGSLVNNAGYGQQGPFEETPLDVFRAQFETNLFAVVGLCQLVLPGMRKARRGRIVNLSSMGGRLTFPGGSAYHASKFALEAISDVMRFETAGFGIRVVLIEPGPTTSAFGGTSIASLDSLIRVPDGAYDALRTGIRTALESTFAASDAASDSPSGSSTPEEIAEAVWAAVSEPTPEPRVVVGAIAESLIARKESGSAEDWDSLVATMYPQPGSPADTKADS
jgi:NAD(P)-dependent dehydrogenase (short-subunit alcohol dehydrogenase family)